MYPLADLKVFFSVIISHIFVHSVIHQNLEVSRCVYILLIHHNLVRQINVWCFYFIYRQGTTYRVHSGSICIEIIGFTMCFTWSKFLVHCRSIRCMKCESVLRLTFSSRFNVSELCMTVPELTTFQKCDPADWETGGASLCFPLADAWGWRLSSPWSLS